MKEVHTLEILKRIPKIKEKDVKASEVKNAILLLEEQYGGKLKKAIAEQGRLISHYSENTLNLAAYNLINDNVNKVSYEVILVLEQAIKNLMSLINEQCQNIDI